MKPSLPVTITFISAFEIVDKFFSLALGEVVIEQFVECFDGYPAKPAFDLDVEIDRTEARSIFFVVILLLDAIL